MMNDEYTTLDAMLKANNISPAIAEYLICYTLRFLQLQSICEILREDKAEYIRWLNLSRQMQQPTEFARRITKELCHCHLDEYGYVLMGQWLLAFYRKKDTRIIHPPKVREELLHQQHCRCAICDCTITADDELDHIIPWKYVGDELANNLQLLCFNCNRSKKASPLFQLRMLLRNGENWEQPTITA